MAERHQHSSPGWHPDPGGAPDWRWWDGRRWTRHVAPRILPAPMPSRRGLFDGSDASDYAALVQKHAGRLAPQPQDLDARDGAGAVANALVGLAFAGYLAFFVSFSVTFAPHVWLILGSVTAGVVLSLPKGWAALWHRWRVLDTPTVDAAGARPGLCEIAGRAELLPGQLPLTSMLSGQPTIGYQVAVESSQRSGTDRRRVARWSDDRTAALRDGFVVRSDGGGAILVRVADPGRVVRDTARPVREWRGTVQVAERGLVPGDRVFCLGEVTMADDGTLVLDDPDLVVAGVERTVLRRQRGPITQTVVAVVTAVVVAAYYAVGKRNAQDAAPFELPSFDLTAPLPTVLTALGVLALIAAVLLCVRWWNRLIAVREQVRAAWGHIEADLQRRHDTIGRLVTVVRQAAVHEGATLDLVVEARHQLQGVLHHGVPDDPRVQSIGTDIGVASRAERALIAAAERHPQLRTQVAFGQLFDALAAAENRIAAGRRFYNDALTLLDDRVDRLPGLLVRRRILPNPRPTLLQFSPTALPAAGHPWAVPPPPPGVPRSMADARVPSPPARARPADAPRP